MYAQGMARTPRLRPSVTGPAWDTIRIDDALAELRRVQVTDRLSLRHLNKATERLEEVRASLSAPAAGGEGADGPFCSGLRAHHGTPPDLVVSAFCTCGWSGPPRSCDGEVLEDDVRAELEAEREAHEAETGHGRDLEVGANGRHDFGCGFYHGLLDHCPKPASSPAGRVYRVLRAATTDVDDALGALRSIDELRRWLDEQEPHAVVSARLAGATWEQVGETVGTTRQGAWNRWGRVVSAYEKTGILPRSDEEAGEP